MLSPTIDLLNRCNGKTAPLSTIDKGQKLTQGADGTWRLEADTIAFVKSLTAPAKSDLVKSHLAGAHVARVGGHADLQRGFAKLEKRAAMVPISADEMQGATPRVAPIGSPRSEPGLSDGDLRVLEQEITTGNPALAPAQAAKLFLQSYRVIAANPARRLTEESAAYGVPAAPGGYPDRR